MQYLTHGASFGAAGLYVTLMQNSENIIADISTYSLNLPALLKMKKYSLQIWTRRWNMGTWMN
jgi:hypothetical protein|nr:hypothetical protein [Methanohalophilus euhalobius]